MELTDRQIAIIREDIRLHGIYNSELADSAVDHICCCMEEDTVTDFNLAYAKALDSFGVNGLKRMQLETQLIINFKKELTMKKTMYLLGYLALILSTTGLLFKVQHWPGAAVMLVLGVLILNFGFLPMFFYERYKQAAV